MRARVSRVIDAFNARIAVGLTKSVGTMWCAYVFMLLAALGFPGAGATPQAYVQWVSQTCIQLVMLSVIMVGQSIMSQKHDQHHAEQIARHDEHAARLTAIEGHVFGKRLIKREKKGA